MVAKRITKPIKIFCMDLGREDMDHSRQDIHNRSQDMDHSKQDVHNRSQCIYSSQHRNSLRINSNRSLSQVVMDNIRDKLDISSQTNSSLANNNSRSSQ